MEITLGFVIVTKVIAGLIAGLLPIIVGVLIGNTKQGRRWFWLCFMLSLIDFIAAFFAGTILGVIIYQLLPGQNLTLVSVCVMASLVACVTRTPVSIIILLGTMTGFQSLIPIMFASLTGFFLAPKTPLINAQLGIDRSVRK